MSDEKTVHHNEKDFHNAEIKIMHLKAIENLPGQEVEAYAKFHNISRGTLFRWKRVFNKYGIDGLIRKQRGDKGKLRKCTEELDKLIKEKYLKPTRPTAREVYREIKNLRKSEGVTPPSYAIVLKVIRGISKKISDLARYGKKDNQLISLATNPQNKNSDHEQNKCYQKIDNRPLLGERINFEGLVHAPVEEHAVIYLFGMLAKRLGFEIESFQNKGIDCEAKRKVKNKRWQRVSIEFEFRSSNFEQHNHNIEDCDLIICWEHDWENCPLEVIELKTEMLKFKKIQQ